jgi:hypothetical protein
MFKQPSAIVLLFLAMCPASWGWGHEGHQIIAVVAEGHLDETTKVMIQSLLGNNHLYSIASWADDVRRERPDTKGWHYVDIPLGGRYDAGRDCALSESCVVLVQLDRMRNIVRDEAGVLAKFGVNPPSIPDYLAVVGDSADGFPGIPSWGMKAASLTFSQYPHLEAIPRDWREWHPSIRKARLLSEALFNGWNDALLFRTLATLRLDVPVFNTVDDLRWIGPHPSFEKHCGQMKSSALLARAARSRGETG